MKDRIVSHPSDHRRPRLGPGAGVIPFLFVVLVGFLGLPPAACAQGWGFAWEVGTIAATPHGNPFVFRLTAVKNYSPEFSLGPSFYITPYGDDAMYSGTLNVHFHLTRDRVRLTPFVGVGLANRSTEDDSDTDLMIPMGFSADTPIGEKIRVLATVSINLHGGIRLEGKKDGASLGLTTGLSYSY